MFSVSACAKALPPFEYIACEDNTVEITGLQAQAGGVGSVEYLEIPAVIDGYAVCAIGGFEWDVAPSYLHISKGIQTIRDDAFYLASQELLDVYIPDTVTYIGDRAFYGPDQEYTDEFMSYVIIPPSVTYMGEYCVGYEFYFPPGSMEDEALPIGGFTVYGETGSVAEQYAQANGFTFVDVHTLTAYDVNCDGLLNTADAYELYSAAAGKTVASSMAIRQADTDDTQSINMVETMTVYRKASGLSA